MGFFGGRYHTRARLYDSLATAVDAGLPPDKALALASEGHAPLASAASAVASGRTLSEALASRPDLFDAREIAAIQAGEHVGRLPDVLARLARYHTARGNALDQLGNRLIYPVILLHGAVLLPPLFLLVSGGIGAYASAVIPALLVLYGNAAVLWWISRAKARDELARERAERFLLSVPVVGNLVQSLVLADYVHLLSVLYSAGTPIAEALDKAARGSRVITLRASARRVAAAVRAGHTLAGSLAQEEQLFGRLLVQAVHVGEEAGKLDDALEKSAVAAQYEAEQALQRLVAVLPAVVFAVAALAVAAVVIRFWTTLAG